MDPVHARFPLEIEKRPKLLDVDTETVNWWKQSARQEITKLMQDKKSWHYKGKCAKEHKELALTYTRHDIRGYTSPSSPENSSRTTAFFCEGILNMSLEDIAYGLYCEHTDDQRAVHTHAFQENFLDSAILEVYERQTVEDPFRFAGIKWAAYIIPPGLVAPSDLLYFEYSCKTRDADGNVVLVQYIASPELLPHQLEEQNVGLARAQTSQITTFRFMDEGTHCQSAGSFEGNIAVPAWVGSKSVHQVFSNMAHLVGLADVRAIASLGTAAAVSTSKACYLCNKKFGMMRTRHNCRSCGQSICAKCTIKLKIFNPPSSSQQQKQHNNSHHRHSVSSASKFTEDRFCLPCVLHAREQRPESGSFSEVVDSISSEESNATAPASTDEDYEVDFWDLHDAIDDIDVLGSVRFDHYGRRRQARKHSSKELSNSKVVSANKSRKPVSPVDAYLHKAKGTKGASASTRETGSLGQQQLYHHVQTEETTAAMPMPVAFSKLTESIAAQEALLQTIQQERQKFHARQQSGRQRPPVYADESSTPSADPKCIPDDGRFEIISEACE